MLVLGVRVILLNDVNLMKNGGGSVGFYVREREGGDGPNLSRRLRARCCRRAQLSTEADGGVAERPKAQRRRTVREVSSSATAALNGADPSAANFERPRATLASSKAPMRRLHVILFLAIQIQMDSF